jgi:hypothetical protein
MQYSLDAMKIALRVLTALTEKRNPSDEEIGRLRELVGVAGEHLPADELACEVIQKALKHRAYVRRAGC